MSDAALQLWNVRKSYGRFHKREALRGVSIRVERGECYGLAGPNGAGKTTLIRLMLGLSQPDDGEVRLLGERPEDPRVRARVGFVPEAAELSPAASPRDLVRRFARLRGLPREARAQGLQQLDRLGMSELLDRPAGKLSKGEKQRTLLALALLGEPELLVLDEPTDGLDPLGRALVRRILHEELQRGRTVFLNSHLLSETERVCSRVGILHRGQLVREERVQARSGDGAGPSAVTLAGGETRLLEHADLAQLNAQLDGLRASGALISEVQRVGRDLEASFEAAVQNAPGLAPADAGPRPPEPPAARADVLRPLRATLRMAQEIAADLAARKVGWFGLAAALFFLAMVFLALRNDIVGGAAAAVRQFGGPGGVADAATVAHFIGRWAAGVVYWALLPGTIIFASMFAPPLLEPRRTILLLAQPVSRTDLACALYLTVCVSVLLEYVFLAGLFYGGMRWLGIAVSPLFLAVTLPLLFCFAAFYAVSLAVAYGVRSGIASGGIAFLVFLAALFAQFEPRLGRTDWRAMIGAVLPRVVSLGEQAARAGGGDLPHAAPFALNAILAGALFLLALFAARRSEQ